MTTIVGQLYRCQNPDCGCELQVTKTSTAAKFNPRCGCGGEIKKLYGKPVCKALDTPSVAFPDIQKTSK
jgi:hypothetical protein